MSEFTVRDGVAWLGLTWEQYEAMNAATKDRHGGPQVDALLAIRTQEQRDATTPEQVLARFGIDPADPVAAARRYDGQRSAFDTAE